MNGASPAIPGYTLGSPAVPRAPITMQELDLLKKTLLFTDEDLLQLLEEAYRRRGTGGSGTSA